MTTLDPSHPGEHIRIECLDPHSLTVTAGARALGISRKTLSELVNCRAGVSPEMAFRLSQAFGATARHWMQLQMNYDLWQAEQRTSDLDVECFVSGEDRRGEPQPPNPLQGDAWDPDPIETPWEEKRTSIVRRLL